MKTDLRSRDVPPTGKTAPDTQLDFVGKNIPAILAPFASLKLTVTLFVMAIFIVFTGTLAQTSKDIWQVTDEYFRTAIAWIDFQIFCQSVFGLGGLTLPGGFYFPGGWAIGTLLAVNLLAAHAVRFKMQAVGTRLAAGLGVLVLGGVLTWLVIASGFNKVGTEADTLLRWDQLWLLLKMLLVAVWLAATYRLVQLQNRHKLERWLLGPLVISLAALLAWLFFDEGATLGDSSMRILWQLVKGSVASLVLLAGCWLIFKKRAGIVLIHGGVGLMMLSELLTGTFAVEGNMVIPEGQTVNYTYDTRTVELAVVDPSHADEDHVTVVPVSYLSGEKTIQDDALPFDVEVIEYFKNAAIVRLAAGEASPATIGEGLQFKAVPNRTGVGTDTSGQIDMPAAYVKFVKKGSTESLGTFLLSSITDLPDQVPIDGKTYDVALRFKRTYKPYSLHLVDFRFDRYLGTNTPKNYSSDLHLVDTSQNVDRDVKIWMNNPLRYAGETFYQSSFTSDESATVLQVVSNTGWMIPYVSCMIVATGLLTHFGIILVRFLRRREEEAARDERTAVDAAPEAGRSNVVADFFPVVVVLIFAFWLASQARQPKTAPEEMQIHEFGKLPVVFQGRVKPLDTLARNNLRIISGKETFRDAAGDRQPAIRWLLDVMADQEIVRQHKVFRITNLELLETLGLERRSGFTYAINEFSGKFDEIDRQAALARSIKEPENRSLYQRQVLKLYSSLRLYMVLRDAHAVPEIRPDHMQEDVNAAIQRQSELSRLTLPHLVPPQSPDGKWEPLTTAVFRAMHSGGADTSTRSLLALLYHYQQGNATEFSGELAKYQAALTTSPPVDYQPSKVSFETFFNQFAPFYHAAVVYGIAFVLSALAWLGWRVPLNRAAFWLIVLALAVHTIALVSRIYISGRPPVTNLYSSAVFIGWGCVVFGLILELFYRLGVGNIIAAVAGFATLIIAHFLSDGDTFQVLQAVLDTQFWLATHVVCITLGYSTTFLAGLLGVLYVLRGVCTPSLSVQVGRDLGRMIYGTLCFAIFFSFVGTVLGGLWADDSWGRFWGWDPKENGALIIVLWNAVVLHSRWGGMARERGLAVLAIVGNIVTCWSWFGVNELSTGLHNYGFTEGTAFWLMMFNASQLTIIALGSFPTRNWWSFRARTAA